MNALEDHFVSGHARLPDADEAPEGAPVDTNAGSDDSSENEEQIKKGRRRTPAQNALQVRPVGVSAVLSADDHKFLVRDECFAMMGREKIPGETVHPIESVDLAHVRRWKSLKHERTKAKRDNDEAKVADIEARLGACRPQVQGMKLFLKGTEKEPKEDRLEGNAWNGECADLFAVEFNRRHPEHEVGKIKTAFKTHIKTLKRQYNDYCYGVDEQKRHEQLQDRADRERKFNVSFRCLSFVSSLMALPAAWTSSRSMRTPQG